MMYGMKYRGRHSREFGLVVKTKTRPALPPVRNIDETAPYRDGSLDYSNQAGRLYYDDKILELELVVIEPELRAAQSKISAVVGWLAGWYGDMIFDDMPNVIWTARPLDISNAAIELYRVGRVTVQFRCRPFNKLIFTTLGIPLDTDIPLDSDIPLDYGSDSAIALAGGSQRVSFQYIGTAAVSPILRITGAGASKLTLSLNGKSLTYEPAFQELEFNCETWRARANGSTDVTAQAAGDYPELLPGSNEISVTVTGTATLEIECYPLFLYGDTGYIQ